MVPGLGQPLGHRQLQGRHQAYGEYVGMDSVTDRVGWEGVGGFRSLEGRPEYTYLNIYTYLHSDTCLYTHIYAETTP